MSLAHVGIVVVFLAVMAVCLYWGYGDPTLTCIVVVLMGISLSYLCWTYSTPGRIFRLLNRIDYEAVVSKTEKGFRLDCGKKWLEVTKKIEMLKTHECSCFELISWDGDEAREVVVHAKSGSFLLPIQALSVVHFKDESPMLPSQAFGKLKDAYQAREREQSAN